MDIMFLRKQAANPMISLATQASTPTPSHQRGQSLPQEDMAMAYQDPAPVQNQLQNHVQHAMKASKYVNQNTQAQTFAPNYVATQDAQYFQTQQPSRSLCSKGQVSSQRQQISSIPASSSSATARYPLPCSTPARWKLGGIQEEKKESPTTRQHCQSLGGGQGLLESRKNLGENAKSSRKDEYSKQESPKSTPSPVDPYINLSFNPALEQLSDASQEEFCHLILIID
ncbi:hypothetical protein PSTG_04695 [Puccinia striiformis f. sp. tritici PST-78]|uniref:Uncharacterized protein n=1 Tax=Puccinia striiformis f. sp. tritici PST-78 TaxID=1165861 RepID=A0A0L0VSD9_9BASI|nr:hypothetical protein PSTG_04695 [Puccinia striiformis f. sp. tritici PST-78]